ncbi:MAG TPA: patatin-like phospholipase family protein [Xanthobacteraceae bacterium]|nr:patatin-like phospholipase family protein [Xanthobacteraceae bacterium]
MHKLRKCSGFAAGLIAIFLLACPHVEWSQAQAQTHAAAKKKAERKAAAPKGAPERQEERTTFTVQDEDAALIPGIPDARVWGDSESEFARLLPQASGPWLAISGGGSDGAYGAGVLTGWSEAGTRPEFAVVTGVSIGGLIAPFAFLGPRYDEELHKNFTTIGAADIFEDRMTRDSLFDYWPLKRIVEQRVTAKLLSEIAAEHARGRRLLVVTTNLDAGRRVVWNMGAIAAHGEQGLKLFRDILLASSSIPGFFSPVPIEVEANGKKFHELHGDGTLTAPFFVMPETMLSANSTSRPPLTQLYVLVNSKLGPEFKMPDRNIPGVLGRSIGVALTAALRAEVMLIYVGAQRHGIALRIAHVDPAFDHPSRGPFDGKYMQALYEVGVAAGKKGAAFGDTLPEFSMRGSPSQQ